MAIGSKPKKRPEFIEGTTTRSMIGPEVDEETGRKIPVDGGVDLKLKYKLAMRLAKMPNPRFVIDPKLREQARKAAKDKAAKEKGGKAPAKNGEKNGEKNGAKGKAD
jgi:hypothetical protein